MSYGPNETRSPYKSIIILAGILKALAILGLFVSGILVIVFLFGLMQITRGGTPMGAFVTAGFPLLGAVLYTVSLFAASELLMLVVRAVEYLKRIEENTRGLPIPPQR